MERSYRQQRRGHGGRSVHGGRRGHDGGASGLENFGGNLTEFTLACIKMGRSDLAEKAISVAEKRLSNDKWPEYYDTRNGRFIGKQSRLYQTWTIAGFLASKMLLDNPEMASILTCEEDLELLEFCVCGLRKTSRTKCSRVAARSQVLV